LHDAAMDAVEVAGEVGHDDAKQEAVGGDGAIIRIRSTAAGRAPIGPGCVCPSRSRSIDSVSMQRLS
jgi:hypothetical protein